jgi:hypothetical protein
MHKNVNIRGTLFGITKNIYYKLRYPYFSTEDVLVKKEEPLESSKF